ncbi:hypothetical protein [Natrinema gelatinilyticum]|uniref:hypothetical protein n=1 Tax=Natrinema gelatinilyticum TaxID=2961571 RepID=UPI0020C5266D|nr:hypothetical protein [Natrinema gelatinilyticum]
MIDAWRTVARGLGATITGTIGTVGRTVQEGLPENDAKVVVRRVDEHGLHMTAELRDRANELIGEAASRRYLSWQPIGSSVAVTASSVEPIRRDTTRSLIPVEQVPGTRSRRGRDRNVQFCGQQGCDMATIRTTAARRPRLPGRGGTHPNRVLRRRAA